MTGAPLTATDALIHRLGAVGTTLGAGTSSGDLTDRLVSLVVSVRESRRLEDTWLLLVGLTAAMPDPDLVRAAHRAIALRSDEDAVLWLLDTTVPLATQAGDALATMRVVTDHALLDVNATAKSEFLTGIQRVVRGVAARWHERTDVEVVVWTSRGGAYRALDETERARVLRMEAAAFDGGDTHADDSSEIIVPWGVPVVVTEVPHGLLNDRLAAMAEMTRSSVRLVGYDCIPFASPELIDAREPEKFGRYLELVKQSDRVAAISRTAAAEFEGFCEALPAQGLTGPEVVACPLPTTVPVSSGEHDEQRCAVPLVVCIGSIGRRKNQVALVEAAETLWREGLEFEVRIFGYRGSEHTPLWRLASDLSQLGRRLVIESGVADAQISAALDEARCLVFPSLHEGFGLPVVEALSQGVPVITSDFGSLREVAEDQGALLVDPSDPGAVASALRALLTDDALHARLVAQAAARPERTWSHYADDLWKALLA